MGEFSDFVMFKALSIFLLFSFCGLLFQVRRHSRVTTVIKDFLRKFGWMLTWSGSIIST